MRSQGFAVLLGLLVLPAGTSGLLALAPRPDLEDLLYRDFLAAVDGWPAVRSTQLWTPTTTGGSALRTGIEVPGAESL